MKTNRNNIMKSLHFYSDGMCVTKKLFTEHHLKLIYQRQSISNLEEKHKEWSRNHKN